MQLYTHWWTVASHNNLPNESVQAVDTKNIHNDGRFRIVVDGYEFAHQRRDCGQTEVKNGNSVW